MSKTQDALTKLRDLPADELRTALARVRDELFRLQLGRHTNQVASTAEITSKRREVARILTILRARDLGKETQGAAKSAAKSRRTKKEG
ncbi:MAG: 50S ribosomal protein L29 [Kofleriaceae bacterium]|jgi:large subunit ribosomal protein L29|nr:50S ribosomal protein L29 [Kofleriaceae bacterium]MBP9171497.1 50S ribosomal protein L29 [Kofleriaceae bacterium]MBP9858794.1 50S ribosomal protein L29 [Kofleriaceae bacterium]